MSTYTLLNDKLSENNTDICNDNLERGKVKENNNVEKKQNVYIKTSKNITGRQYLLIIPLIKFFNNKENLEKLIPILNGTSRISLRIIDWFVTNYCKKNNTMFNKNVYYKDSCTKKKNNDDDFSNFLIVHNNYKGQLKSYNKKNFDPFCRRNRIRFYYDSNKYFVTTVGQLNFFKWAIENNILEYILENIKDIENDMNFVEQQENEKENEKEKEETKISKNETKNTKKNKLDLDNSNKNDITKKKNVKRKKKVSTRKKRTELSNTNKSMVKHNYPTIITFD